MNTYKNYINEIKERKSLNLHPKPIESAKLLSEIIAQIKDIDHIDRKESITFLIYNVTPGTTSAAGVKANFLKEIILSKYSTKEILDLYIENGQIIFNSSLFQEIKSVSGIVNVKYDPEGLESVFQKYFGKSELKDLLKPSLIPVYDLSRGKNYFFRQQKALISPRHNFHVKDLLRGATSALTFFPPAQISTVNNKEHRCFIDGGVFANNPALSAYAEFRYHNSDLHAKDTMMLSLGTGRKTTNLDCEVTANWGAA